MPHPPYIELGLRSAFSFLEGASLPEDLIERAAELNHGTLGLADVNGLYGAPRFHQAARKHGLRALIGARITLLGAGEPRRKSDPPLEGGQILLLVRNHTGYRNLCRALTRGHAPYPKPHCRVTREDLRAHAKGLLGIVREPHLARSLREVFGRNLFVELWRHAEPDEERQNRALLNTGIPPVATGDVRHARAKGKRLLDALTCLRHKTTLDEA